MSPKVFNQWWRCVEMEELGDINQKLYRVSIVCFSNKFKLASSLRKTTYKDQLFLIKPIIDEAFPNADSEDK